MVDTFVLFMNCPDGRRKNCGAVPGQGLPRRRAWRCPSQGPCCEWRCPSQGPTDIEVGPVGNMLEPRGVFGVRLHVHLYLVFKHIPNSFEYT